MNRRLLVVVARRLVCVRPRRAPPRSACTCGPAMGGGRDARKAEAAVKKKLIADAAVVLGKIEAAQSAEALAAAIKEAKPFSSIASIQQAIPAATQRLATLKAQADKATTRDFLSRVEEAERRDMKHPSAKNKAEEQLKRYFEEFFQEGGRRRGPEKTWCVTAPCGSGLGLLLGGNGVQGVAASLRPKYRPPSLALRRDFEEFKEAMDIIAPSIRGKDLKAAFALAVRRRRAPTPGSRLAKGLHPNIDLRGTRTSRVRSRIPRGLTGRGRLRQH